MRGANVTAHRSWVLASKLLHHVMDVVLKPLRGKCWSFKLTQMVFSVMPLSTVSQIDTRRPARGDGASRRAGPSTCAAVQPKMTLALPSCSARPVLPYASWLKPLQCYQLHQPALHHPALGCESWTDGWLHGASPLLTASHLTATKKYYLYECVCM